MTKPKRPMVPGRYSDEEIAARVERERQRKGFDVKTFADKIGMSQWTYYKRAEGSHPFTVEELGRCADILGAPPLWPFAEWSMLERLFRRGGP